MIQDKDWVFFIVAIVVVFSIISMFGIGGYNMMGYYGSMMGFGWNDIYSLISIILVLIIVILILYIILLSKKLKEVNK